MVIIQTRLTKLKNLWTFSIVLFIKTNFKNHLCGQFDAQIQRDPQLVTLPQ
jgi:hypothetical protein